MKKLVGFMLSLVVFATLPADAQSSTVFYGGGLSQPVGHNVAMTAVVLYNFSYSDSDLFRPYDSPWIVRVGISAGF